MAWLNNATCSLFSNDYSPIQMDKGISMQRCAHQCYTYICLTDYWEHPWPGALMVNVATSTSPVSKSSNLTNSKAVRTITKCALTFGSLHVPSLNCSWLLSMSLSSYHSVVNWVVCSGQAIFTKVSYQVLDGSGTCATTLRTQAYAPRDQLVHSLTGWAYSNML